MSIFVRTKRVTDPLDDRVKACICGTGGGFRPSGSVASSTGSGSEHEADTCFLDDLVNGFLEEGGGGGVGGGDCEDCGGGHDGGAGGGSGGSDGEYGCGAVGGRDAEAVEMIEGLVDPGSGDRYRRRLWKEAERAAEALSSLRGEKEVFRRAVMGFLRDSGHNAGVCKTRWESSGGLTGGNYEFIDVVVARRGGASVRYLVELDFAAEFEIARPTEEFSRLARALPRVFVGRSEELRQIVRVVSDAARRSLKKRGMHLPPWRKNRYLQAKWLGPYRRTVNPVAPGSRSNASDMDRQTAPPASVRCRSVGFFSAAQDTPVGNRRYAADASAWKRRKTAMNAAGERTPKHRGPRSFRLGFICENVKKGAFGTGLELCEVASFVQSSGRS
ncbi:hypothetical protein H6P81_012142 [Aristolochia fimbriata]|uniref:Uncharacterized protein n=1 Tax=Aristolochia fimbriata TaxID=158543 RepID=A0AAV7EBC8_ARIFI|nr:hypothetical protein H6P81_012142 [Aristolochia fimbriata]